MFLFSVVPLPSNPVYAQASGGGAVVVVKGDDVKSACAAARQYLRDYDWEILKLEDGGYAIEDRAKTERDRELFRKARRNGIACSFDLGKRGGVQFN
jgi:hypothetical protein